MQKRVTQVIIEKLVIRDGVVTKHTPGWQPDIGTTYHPVTDKELVASQKWHNLCARATLYPGKSIEEVMEILDY